MSILKRLEAALQGKQNGLKKTEACLFSLSTQLTTTTVLQFNTFFHLFVFPALSAQTKDPIFFSFLVKKKTSEDGCMQSIETTKKGTSIFLDLPTGFGFPFLPFTKQTNKPQMRVRRYASFVRHHFFTQKSHFTMPAEHPSIARRFQPVTPENEGLEYRGIVLTNGMKVLLVRNADESEATSVALALARGNMSDPKIAGMAHFCEHMLFLGNEAYPIEGDYKRYLREHGGSCNASTGSDETKYYFSVVSGFFDGAFDRFLHFFLSPLFTSDATLRELNAVHSEYGKNCLSDDRRELFLLKSIANQEHPYSNFGCGNIDTLLHEPRKNGVDIRERLLQFYEENYSSDIMSLVIRSDLPLDKLEASVCNGFSKVLQKGLKHLPREAILGQRHFTPAELGQVARYATLGERREVRIVFPRVVSKVVCEKERCDQVVIELLGHEGSGSLCCALRTLGLVTEVASGELRRHATGFGHIALDLTLTEQGMANVFEVVGEVYRYAAMLRGSLPSVKAYWEEQRRSCAVRFNHRPRPVSSGRVVSQLASALNNAATPEEVLTHGRIWNDNFDESSILATLEDICVDNSVILLTGEVKEEEERRTKYYDVKYSLRKYTAEEKAAMNAGLKGAPSYALPVKNIFIPESFDLVAGGDVAPTEHPTVAHQCSFAKVWWKQDTRFLTPKTNASLYLMSSALTATCRHKVFADAYVNLLCMAFEARYYDADVCAPWHVATNHGRSALHISLKGFSDKVPLLMTMLLEDVLAFVPEEQEFCAVKDTMVRACQNEKLKTATVLANRRMREAMVQGVTPAAFSDAAVEAMTFADVLHFAKEFKTQVTALLFVHGNVTHADAMKLGNDVVSILKSNEDCHAMSGQPRPRRVVALPPTAGTPLEYCLAAHEPNPSNVDSAVVIKYQIGADSFRTQALLAVLAQVCYNVMFGC